MVRRNSLRLENYDYSSRGNYFITICTHQRECFFGLPDSNHPIEKSLQTIVNNCWIGSLSENLASKAFIIMPNHLHLILEIKQSENFANPSDIGAIPVDVGAIHELPLHQPPLHQPEPIFQSSIKQGTSEWIKARRKMLVSKVIGKFKMQSSKQINNFLEDNFGERPFRWQRNYYDHIIRNQKSLKKIIQYIDSNPSRWTDDILNPINSYEFGLKSFKRDLG